MARDFGGYLPSRAEMNVLEFIPVVEMRTIGRAELKAAPRALNEVTMLNPASILCDSKYIVDGSNRQAAKWWHDVSRTTSGVVMHIDM